MGMYFNCEDGRLFGKGDELVSKYKALKVSLPEAISVDCKIYGLIIVVRNPMFEAAAWAYSNPERDIFLDTRDMRPKEYYVLDRKVAEEICK